jgi:uncharacterized protein (TIGR03084 family)
MLQVSADLKVEADDLGALLEPLSDADWERSTPFNGWSVLDVVAHLHYFDRISLLSLQSPEGFDEEARWIGGMMRMNAAERAAATLERLGDPKPGELLATWHAECHRMCDLLGESDPQRRLRWFGPDMGLQMFTTARYMETWAHGHDVYDLLGRERAYTDAIKNIAVIGVKTFGWTFVNRKREVPGLPPFVRLTAPSGEVWEWNDPDSDDRVSGSAAEFCHVVTQGRNVQDTALEVVGPVAKDWMTIAQCFAGGPVDPPAPGTRT